MTGPVTMRIGGAYVERALLRVPARGAWSLDVDLLDDTQLDGAVEVLCGPLTLRGTVVARSSGAWAYQRRTRIVAGAAGWGTRLASRSYHSDAGVSRRLVLRDLASDAGETIDDATIPSEALGVDYVRGVGIASRTLEEVGGAAWYVDLDGVTHIGEREQVNADNTIAEVLDYDPRRRLITLGVDAIDAIVVGSVISDPRLPDRQTVRSMEIEITSDAINARAWCAPTGADRLEAALEALIARSTDAQALGLWRYRVTGRDGDRLQLEPSSQADGLPRIQPIAMWPGVAGAYASIPNGAEVLVGFIGGRRDAPVVLAFTPHGGGSAVPDAVTFDATGASASIKAGANASETPAWASKLRAELLKIAGALAAATAPSGGGPLTWAPGTDYPVASVPAASALGAAKLVCE